MAKQLLIVLFVLASIGFVPAHGRGQGGLSTGVIEGTVLYRQRIALPPEAIVEISLLDVSLADAPAKPITQAKIPAAGKQVPIPFKLEYKTADIQPSHRYALRAEITQNGELLFTSTRAYPVLSNPGAPESVEIMLDQVQARPDSGEPSSPLEDTYWKLVEVYGQPITPSLPSREAHIELRATARTFTGSTGCNRLSGSYMKTGEELRFKMVASTMMACTGAIMRQEQSLNRALGATVRFQITGQTLELFSDRQMVARFEARPGK